ncbi:MAG: Glu/Leu/Phe/Val dehydrogenase dimerization domain-containing protein [Nitriliruptoraceae bacterium]
MTDTPVLPLTAEPATSPPELELTWTDPVTGVRGYLVVDRLIGGMASGGFRVREGLTMDEVAGLARAMTAKEAIVYDPDDRYLPFGGAKGGLDLDPADPRLDEVLTRLFTTLQPVLEHTWATGEDLGVAQATLDAAAQRAGLDSTIEALFRRMDDVDAARQRLATAFDVEVEGVALADLVGGYGVARATVALARARGLDPTQLTAVVQGFGSIGGAAARYLARAGLTVIGIADRDGLVLDRDGLDVEAMLAARDRFGAIERSSLPGSVVERDRDTWVAVDADVLVPAAVGGAIHAENAHNVRSTLVVEGGNLPVTPAADAVLTERGVAVLPDVLANVGTNAWWWWIVFGDVAPTADAAFTRIDATMHRLVAQVYEAAMFGRTTLRAAAHELAHRNASEAAARVTSRR